MTKDGTDQNQHVNGIKILGDHCGKSSWTGELMNAGLVEMPEKLKPKYHKQDIFLGYGGILWTDFPNKNQAHSVKTTMDRCANSSDHQRIGGGGKHGVFGSQIAWKHVFIPLVRHNNKREISHKKKKTFH